MPIAPPPAFDDETYAWGYAPPSHLEGQPSVPIPDKPPGADIAPNQPVTLPSGVVAYRETYGHRERLMALEHQAQAAQQASKQAMQDSQMFQQMARVAKSTKDIEIARRSIDVMGLQRDIQNGVPIHQAVARHPMALGSGFGSALKSTVPTPAFTPESTTVGGVPMVSLAPNRFQQVRQPPTLGTPKAVDVDGTKMVQVAPNRFQQVRQPPEGKLTDQQKSRIATLRNEHAQLLKDMGGTSWELKKKAGGFEKEIAEKETRLQTIQQEIDKIQGVAPAAAPSASKAVAVLGSGTKADPARPTSPEQFASVPAKAYYINPEDGKLYQKK